MSDGRDVIITIDGPAGTGKTTVAHRLARRLGLDFLDTGAMYRAAALVAIEGELDPADGARLATALRNVDVRFDWATDPPRLSLDGRDVSERIRDDDVAKTVSTVAAQRAVREVLVGEQRRIAAAHPRLVTEGRDQGSVVFPDAPVRFYLDADLAERARRRAAQLAATGRTLAEADVVSRLRERDQVDSTRDDGPLVRPVGAIEVDTTDRTLDEVVAHLESITRERLPDGGFRP